jgi:hypothetical protein
MPRLPHRPNLDHLKKQAKDLLALYRKGDAAALARFRAALPAAAAKSDEAIASLGLRLHDAQSCLAREYGFASWADLKSFVAARLPLEIDKSAAVLAWLRLVYPGHIAGGVNRARPVVAARMLEERRSNGEANVSEEEQFIAACARGDEATARSIQSRRSDLPGALSGAQLRLLPELAGEGSRAAVEVMVKLGWPIAATGGDWQASALNHAVFRGDAALTRFLLEHGASWREQHGFGDNACGTLGWASVNVPVEGGDWVGCTEALLAHGMPAAAPDPEGADSVIIDGRRKWFSDEVRDFLLEVSHRST